MRTVSGRTAAQKQREDPSSVLHLLSGRASCSRGRGLGGEWVGGGQEERKGGDGQE